MRLTHRLVNTINDVVADAMAKYEFGRWRLSVNATNLFNRRCYLNCTTNGCGEGTDRTIIAGLCYRGGAGRWGRRAAGWPHCC